MAAPRKPVRATRPRPAAAAPASAPAPSFYTPTDEAPPVSQLGARNAVEEATFASRTRAQSDDLDPGLSADSGLVDHAINAGDDAVSLAREIARIRAMRKPLGAYSLKLDLPKRNGYHRHWFNDVAGRVDQAKENGWTFVVGKDGNPMKRNVGRGTESGVMHAYAMELPEVFWMEDQEQKNRVAQERLDSLKKTPFRAPSGGSEKSDGGKFYNAVEDSAAEPLQIVQPHR